MNIERRAIGAVVVPIGASKSLAHTRRIGDPLHYLPCSTIVEYRKGDNIYAKGDEATTLFLIVSGRVSVSRPHDEGKSVLLDIYKQDEFFGEGTLASPAERRNRGCAAGRPGNDLDARRS